ncbi:antigen 5 like allergen Cul n 1-like [Haematobia irritans]|uniref:antigen 5 like allergen Cul n 1-like n=1 Tax=Haematobia irritans TaxID=7368 RepID=UPI003F4FA913
MQNYLHGFYFPVVLVTILTLVEGTNYCSPSVCGSKGRHIACGHNGNFATFCPNNVRSVNMDKNLKATILKVHNAKRNFIAGGGDYKHPKACRMATMQWDDELASLADLNVRQCRMNHDRCHNTDTFKYSGQNLFLSSYSESDTDEQMMTKAVESWFNEVKNSRMEFIKKFPSRYQGPPIGHFTVMMTDRNIRVGCAAAIFKENGKWYTTYLIACNYATTNMVDHPIYDVCPVSASKCITGKNHHYPNLCSSSERYNVNKWY